MMNFLSQHMILQDLTPFHSFGRSAECQMERELITDYTRSMETVMQRLNAENISTALEIARIPEQIKGFGHVKDKCVDAARVKWDGLMKLF